MSLDSFPYQLATNGVNSKNTYTIATAGYNFNVEIIPIPPTPIPPQEFIPPSGIFSQQEDDKRYYKNIIKVSVEIDGIVYTQDKLIEDVEVSADDIKLSITRHEDKPIINIFVIK